MDACSRQLRIGFFGKRFGTNTKNNVALSCKFDCIINELQEKVENYPNVKGDTIIPVIITTMGASKEYKIKSDWPVVTLEEIFA